MEKLYNYLITDYLEEKKKIESVEEIIKKVLPMYLHNDSSTGWPYIIYKKSTDGEVADVETSGEVADVETSKKKRSISTTAMIAYSMSVLMGGYFNLNSKEKSKKYFGEGIKSYKEILKSEIEELKKIVNEGEIKSNTYGDNDIFTLSWIASLIQNYNICELDELDELKKELKDKLKITITSLCKIGGESSIETEHIINSLKIAQIIDSNFFSDEILKNKVKACLNNRLHFHLGLSNIDNSNFDTAELVFALEGLILLTKNRDNFDENLLNTIFKIIKQRQDISLYWRPLRPIKTKENGMALLPVSVEIAMSLLRICNLMGDKGLKIFMDNYEIFNVYTNWVKSRLLDIGCNDIHSDLKPKDSEKCERCKKCDNNTKGTIYGWSSEHTYQMDVIHPWETSQVLIYLANFTNMLNKCIESKLLTYSRLSIKYIQKNEKAWNEFLKREPSKKGHNRIIYEKIQEKYLSKNESYSMLLYGPPGTGKSTIAEKIAEQKGWPLITITPSDFITNGQEEVELKAKSIFTVLNEQKSKVVLFDEIDRLILDRDSTLYLKQSDMFQFLTPSMLVKLKELRERKNIIFIIATNYEERIDLAIKRAGRIDNKFLILPPDNNARKKIIGKIIEDLEENKREILKKHIEKIANNTSLSNYGELQSELKNLSVEDIKTDSEFKKYLEELSKKSWTISIEGLNSKLTDENIKQKPVDEILNLISLFVEPDLNRLDKKNIKNLISEIEKKAPKVKEKVKEKIEKWKVAD